jgi:hypothetical protein
MAAGKETSRNPEVTTDVPVGAMRAVEFIADEPGDWAIHCHKSHHTMNAMGHEVKTFIGVDKKDLAKSIRKLAPDYMPMGTKGMADMGEMEMPMPDNTLPMMTGFGQFGPIEMGGMFSAVKVREGLARDEYEDPGPYKNPPGTVAYEVASVEAGRTPNAKLRTSYRKRLVCNYSTMSQGAGRDDRTMLALPGSVKYGLYVIDVLLGCLAL